MGMGDTLKEKHGPLPTWGWVIIGIIVLALYLKHRKATAASSSTTAAADQSNSNLGSAAELANMFEVAGLMPYQGGATYVNTTQDSSGSSGNGAVTPTINNQNPSASKDIQVSSFQTVPSPMTWSQLAAKYGVFGGSGAALYEYNLIPNKHSAPTLAALKKSPTTVPKGEKVAIPTSGFYINLPQIGTVKS